MIAPNPDKCPHDKRHRHGRDRKGNPRFKCQLCGKTWTERQANPLGDMRISLDKAKLALRLLVEGTSVRATERITGMHAATICKLLVFFGDRCRQFMDRRMQNLNLTHLQIDEQHTIVLKKQARLTMEERASRSDIGEMYIWTCIDSKTKLLPSVSARRTTC